MDGYFSYISGLVGSAAIVPVMFVIAIVGPLVLFNILHHNKPQWLSAIKWPLAVLTFFTGLFLFISTGGYVGSQFNFTAFGMGVGLAAFYYAYNIFTGLLPSTCAIENK